MQKEYFSDYVFEDLAKEILDKNPNHIETDYLWGLLPSWTKKIEFRKNSFNYLFQTSTYF